MMLEPITADDTIAVLLAKRPGAARVLLDHRMHCVGCAMARFETIAEACAIYGLPVRLLLAALNADGGGQRSS